MNCFGIIAALSLLFKQENELQGLHGESHSFVRLSDEFILLSNFKAKLVPGSLSSDSRAKTELIARMKPAMVTIYQPGKGLSAIKSPQLHSQLATKKAKVSLLDAQQKSRIPSLEVVAKPALKNLSFPSDVHLSLGLKVAKSEPILDGALDSGIRRSDTRTTPKGFMELLQVPVAKIDLNQIQANIEQARASSSQSKSAHETTRGDLPDVKPPKVSAKVTQGPSTKTSSEAASQFAPLANSLITILETKLVNISVVGAPLRSIISSLSTQSGINVLLISKPEQEVTINMRSVTLNEALKHLSVICGLKVVKVKNTVVIGEESALKSAYPKEYAADYAEVPGKSEETSKSGENTSNPENLNGVGKPKEISRVITTKYLSAMNLANSLSTFLQKRNVSIVAMPNTLIPMVNQGAAGGGVGAGGGAGAGQAGAGMGAGAPIAAGGAVGGVGDASLMRSKKLLIVGPPDEVESVIRMIQESDVQRRLVEITVTIHDVANDALKEEGFNWTLGAFSLTENNAGSINFGSFSRTGLSFQSAMKGLEQNQKAKLLASPNVTVMDGEQSTILVGERRQFPIVNGTTPQGQFIFSTQEQNVGISLQVAADISEDGTVTMAVHPMVSSIIGFLQVNGGSYPQISTRESSSTLSVKDGQTILMGGLLRDEEIKNFEQLPLLGKIPFFGELFKYRKTVKNNSQLIISITPRIIKAQ
jgi:Flp pilus assembly secretin CpaC